MDKDKTVNQEKARLKRLADRIERAQQAVLDMVAERDELIADMLLGKLATGDQLGEIAGLSQPRTAQIKAAVVKQRAEAAKAAQRKRERDRRAAKKAEAAGHVAVVTAA